MYSFGYKQKSLLNSSAQPEVFLVAVWNRGSLLWFCDSLLLLMLSSSGVPNSTLLEYWYAYCYHDWARVMMFGEGALPLSPCGVACVLMFLDSHAKTSLCLPWCTYSHSCVYSIYYSLISVCLRVCPLLWLTPVKETCVCVCVCVCVRVLAQSSNIGAWQWWFWEAVVLPFLSWVGWLLWSIRQSFFFRVGPKALSKSHLTTLHFMCVGWWDSYYYMDRDSNYKPTAMQSRSMARSQNWTTV